MAFGISREELNRWKREVASGRIAFLTHYWHDPRFPTVRTVTKVGCADTARLAEWCRSHGLDPRHIHYRTMYPHFDLIGPRQTEILLRERLWSHLERFRLLPENAPRNL
jgi:hypothetical protein